MKIKEEHIQIKSLAGYSNGDPVIYIKSYGGLHLFFKSQQNGKTEVLAASPNKTVSMHFSEENDPSIKWNDNFLSKSEDDMVEDLIKSENDNFEVMRSMIFSTLIKSERSNMKDYYHVYDMEKEEIGILHKDDIIKSINDFSDLTIIRKADLSDSAILIRLHPKFRMYRNRHGNR